MIVVSEVIRNAKGEDLSSKEVDFFDIEWFESTRNLLRKISQKGEEVGMRVLKENFRLKHHDVLWEDGNKILLVNILPSDAVVVQPKTMREMGTICFEIGNQHIPIFIENDEVIIPYEDPIFNLLTKGGYAPFKGKRIFEDMLKASSEHEVSVKEHKIDTAQLFSKVFPKKD